jgi:phosphoglycolate phosphatase-like HAD superfamily hydrolase
MVQGLVGFDNDGTLTAGFAPCHAWGYIDAARKLPPIYQEALAQFSDDQLYKITSGMIGKSIKQICTKVVEHTGIALPEGQFAWYEEKTAQEILARVKGAFRDSPNRAKYIIPGVVEFLNGLRERGQARGIITGNPKDLGELVLHETGLMERFPSKTSAFGYGDNATGKPQIAERAYNDALNKEIRMDYFAVVGDAKSDMEGGLHIRKQHGERVHLIGVLTGTGSEKDLKDAGADIVVPNLAGENAEQVYQLLGI